MRPADSFRFVHYAVLTVVFFFGVLFLLRPVSDADFFWHLKTGDWISDHGELPDRDPFSFTSPQTGSVHEKFFLTSYWLIQVVYHFFYKWAGFYGIVCLRLAFAVCLTAAAVRFRKGDALIYSSLSAVFLVVLFEAYPLDRPQLFSFLFFFVLLGLLDDLRSDSEKGVFRASDAAAPVLMVVWANVHGGFLVGCAAICIFILMEGIRFAHRAFGPLQPEIYLRLTVVGLVSIVCSLINPNTYHVLQSLPSGNVGILTNLEFQSTLTAFQKYGAYVYVLFWMMMALSVLSLIVSWKRPDLSLVVLLSVVGWQSFNQLRYVPFFMAAAVPYVAVNLSREKLMPAARMLLSFAAAASFVYFGMDESGGLSRLRTGRWVDESRYPVAASNFISNAAIKGDMFNYYNWGGYLIWRLWPEKKVFIDGRNMYSSVNWDYLSASIAYSGTGSATPQWKMILDKYDIQFVILPVLESPGQPAPLSRELLRDSGWIPVFCDYRTIVFVRDGDLNRAVADKYGIDRNTISIGTGAL